MSVEAAPTIRPRCGRLLVLGCVATMFTAGCGSAGDAPAAEPRRESVTERGQQLVRVHYTRPLPPDPDGGYGVEMDVIARGADQSRTKMDLLVEEGRVDETVLFIRDGNRALLYDAEAETPYTLMEAADEHPEDLPWESSPLEPDSDLFQQACPDAEPAGTRTIVGRDAVGYACTLDDPDPAMDQAEEIWLDKATGMLLEFGTMKAREFVVDPEIDENTFSTKPPAGADVHVVKATGKGPPPPDEGDEPELSPEDALVSGSEVPGDLSIDAGQSLTIWYGEDFQMSTTQFVPGHYRNSVGCSRLQPLRGVPTVEQAEAVSLITADAALTEVGNGRRPASPTCPQHGPGRQACGAKPGDHGRPLPN